MKHLKTWRFLAKDWLATLWLVVFVFIFLQSFEINWLSELDSMKDLFHRLMPDNRADRNYSGMEWYKCDDEMLFMMRVR